MKKLWQLSSSIWKILSIVFIVFSFSCSQTEENLFSKKNDEIPDQQSDYVTIITTNSDIIEQEITAVHIDRYTKKKLTLADTIFVKNFTPEGELQSTISCDKAEIDDVKNILTGIGNVVVTSDNGILKTPYLIWNRYNDEIYAKDGVTLIRKESVLNGMEMITDINLEKIKIIKVTAEGKIDAEEIDW